MYRNSLDQNHWLSKVRTIVPYTARRSARNLTKVIRIRNQWVAEDDTNDMQDLNAPPRITAKRTNIEWGRPGKMLQPHHTSLVGKWAYLQHFQSMLDSDIFLREWFLWLRGGDIIEFQRGDNSLLRGGDVGLRQPLNSTCFQYTLVQWNDICINLTMSTATITADFLDSATHRERSGTPNKKVDTELHSVVFSDNTGSTCSISMAVYVFGAFEANDRRVLAFNIGIAILNC